jgi:methylated-DNA-protein-cysteine methyltransferase-like protein
MVDRLTFDRIVWKIVWQIPAGRVISYGQIASMIPMPKGMELPAYERIAPRWVGYAMRRCMSDDFNNPGDPSQPSIPWQRVINRQGRISLAEGSYDAEQQRTRLDAEGVEFDRSGCVDFDEFGWDGPDDEWLHANNLKHPYSLKRN